MARDVVLPTSIVSPTDIGRLRREIETVDQFLEAASLRKGGEAMQLPKTSRLFDEIVAANKLNMLTSDDRTFLKELLDLVRDSAPVIHMSFSVDPPPAAMRRLVEWLRREIHPQLLVRVGLQPNIGAGVVVRTRNKYFDFSLKQHFTSTHEVFTKRLHTAVAEREGTAS